MRSIAIAIILSLLPGIVMSCQSLGIDGDRDNLIADPPENQGVANALKKAKEFAWIMWTPIHDVPNNAGSFIAGRPIIGLPYSSTKEIDKYIGINVSIVTFMTAVNNPRSVLYTENLRKAPYHGSNCATYYGVVCSSVIDYALGLGVNYLTAMMDTLSIFERVPVQVPESLKLCDVMLSSGHEVMIAGITRNKNDLSIKSISVFEAAGVSARIRSYSYRDFCERWKDDNWVAYRYKYISQNLSYSKCPFISVDGGVVDHFKYNDVLCLNRGDYAVFREGEEIVVDIFDKSYDRVLLSRDGSFLRSDSILNGDRIVYSDLEYGRYSAIAVSYGGNQSDEIHFEVVDTNVSASLVNNGKDIRVNFDSKYGRPKYVVLCRINGAVARLVVFDENVVDSSSIILDYPKERNEVYCKVYFATDNGMVTNEPILLKKQL